MLEIEDRGIVFDAAARPPAERIAFFTSLCTLQSGDLLCGFQVGPGKHAPTAALGLCRSRDGGATWQRVAARFDSSVGGVPGSLSGPEVVEVEPGKLLLFTTWFD